MLSLIDRIENVAEYSGRTITFIAGDDHETVSWADLHERARAAAAGLQARGVGPGDHVALLGPTTRNLITAIQAVWLTGATLVTMPLPMRMGALEVFIEQTRNRIRRSDSAMVLIDAELMAFVEPVEGTRPSWASTSSATRPGPPPTTTTDPSRTPTLAVLQFTSGSTSEPKGNAQAPQHLPQPRRRLEGRRRHPQRAHRVLAAALPRHGSHRPAHDPDDPRGRPDPGSPRRTSSRSAPLDEVALGLLGHGHRGPNFAYALAARTLRRCEEPLDLSSVRVLLNGAEPVDPGTFRRFFGAGSASGSIQRCVPRLRHGRGVHRRNLPRAGQGPVHRLGGQADPRDRPDGGRGRTGGRGIVGARPPRPAGARHGHAHRGSRIGRGAAGPPGG
ncbi:MAG: AMP-binding protein [Microthrixaceae bacterium]